MVEGRDDDEMIEIGDPTEESSAAEPSPQVVIQYHERGGVPWMLIPPLLMISAMVAIVLYIKFAPSRHLAQAPALVREAGDPRPPVEELATPEPPARAPSASFRDLTVEGVAEESIPVVVAPTEPIAPPMAPAPVEVAVEPARVAEPPQVQGIGFDPKALEADRKAEAPADPAIAPALREAPPDVPDKPREVDPDLLPPDPREARARQQKRRVDAVNKLDEERLRFHVELKAICNKFRESSGPEIREMAKRYDTRTEPKAEKKAAYLLGMSGPLVGADRRTRIDLLRSLGFPEPVILSDLFNNYENKLIHERGGPRSEAEAYYLSALMLLRYPPSSLPASRAASTTKDGSAARPASSVLGKRAGAAQ